MGFDIGPHGADHLTPDDLATGARFREAGIHGVVESDFFDWPIEVDGGRELIRPLATRLSRFDWSAPEHDVLKHLYEAIITPESRQAMGEYYTPDWLAEAMVEESVPDPLQTRALDVTAPTWIQGIGCLRVDAPRRTWDHEKARPGKYLVGPSTLVLAPQLDKHRRKPV